MTQQDSKKTAKQFIRENVPSLVIAVLVVLAIRSSFVEPYRIPSGSMIPTLLVGDHIFVKKYEYGFKVPFSDTFFDDPIYLTKQELPKSGDIVVFKYPKDPSIFYIKRVVGLPGDTIEVKEKQLFINDQPVSTIVLEGTERERVLKKIDSSDYRHEAVTTLKQELNSASAMILYDSDIPFHMNFGPVKVPDGKIFVMGDNRDHSSDSRIWGFAPISYIKGKAVVVWLSIWIDFTERKFIFRPARIGNYLY